MPDRLPPEKNDPVYEHYTGSIYRRFDYIVNSDMSIPFATAHAWMYGVASESGRRPGFAENDRRPELTPLVLRPPSKIAGGGG